VVSAFSSQGVSIAVVKFPLTRTAVLERQHEAVMRSRLRAAASRAGAVVPTGDYRQHGRPALHLSVLAGEPAVHALRFTPNQLGTVVREVGEWLEQWHVLTARPARATAGRLAREILEPAGALAHRLADGAAYVTWLEQRCARIEGAPLPLVASHNDLTMSNLLLLSGHPRLGVLDWEAARDDGLPLLDLFYAAASARRSVRPRREGARSLIEAFDRGSPFGRSVADIAARTSERLELPPDIVELLAHACAVQHAVDEEHRGARASQPFMELVQWMARTRELS
jgi:aminoglycoside phosphotransferase (APT) family kinase protein